MYKRLKMKIKLYQIDAFTNKVFHGNPAAVCVLDEWPSKLIMQQIAEENNLAETAFAIKKGDNFEIRWFTPAVEVDLCGHATLATAFVLFEFYNYPFDKIIFHTKSSGTLSVEKDGKQLTLDFPVDEYKQVEIPHDLISALDKKPIEAYKGKTDYLLIFSTQKDIKELKPDFGLMKSLKARGIIVSAPGDHVDFVSRFFAPQLGINEDPVTGSAHTTLIPYWSKRLNKNMLNAKQLSKRGGDLYCEYLGERVKISGQAVTYLIGEIEI